MSKLSALLVGLGNIGFKYDYHVPFSFDDSDSSDLIQTHCRALACHPGFDFLGAIDISSNACNHFTSIYKLPAFKTLSHFLNTSTIRHVDVVVIAVPSHLQLTVLEECCSLLSFQLVLIEKPPALSEDSSEVIKALSTTYNIAVNYIRRYLPSIQLLSKLIRRGELGSFSYGSIVYSKGLLTNGSHYVDLCSHLIGLCKLSHVSRSTNSSIHSDQEVSFSMFPVSQPNSLITVNSLHTDSIRAGELDIWFTRGRVRWSNGNSKLEYWLVESSDSYSDLQISSIPLLTNIDKYQYYVYNNIYKHITESSPLICSVTSALSSIKPVLAALSHE